MGIHQESRNFPFISLNINNGSSEAFQVIIVEASEVGWIIFGIGMGYE